MPHVPAPVPADLMTYEQAAQQLGITLDSMRTAVTRGRIRPVKLPGRHYKFLRQRDVDEYQQKRRVDYPDQTPQEEASASASVPVAQIPPSEILAFVRDLLASVKVASLESADRAAANTMATGLSALQILHGQQPTLDPKALAV